ncbi:uncharacterized protein [Amphiura filiformis]|uniref:uncharacterized protein n=1 Tax=Amphiura filiformis TaxID=82378 RepID=UPI003B216B51
MCCDQCLTLWLYAKNFLLRGERRMHRVAAKLAEDTGGRTMVKFMLTLVRHGETTYNKEGIIQGQLDIPLSDEGLMQADLLGKYLRNDKFTSIYASDLKRAYQTAEAIVKHSASTQPAIIADARLRERNFGVLEGEPSQRLINYKREAESRLQAADKQSPGNRSPMSFTPEGAETIYEVKDRAIQFFEDLCKQFLNSVELNSQQPRKARRMSPPSDEKSPTGSCTSESSVEPLAVDICSTPDDSVGPSGTTLFYAQTGLKQTLAIRHRKVPVTSITQRKLLKWLLPWRSKVTKMVPRNHPLLSE